MQEAGKGRGKEVNQEESEASEEETQEDQEGAKEGHQEDKEDKANTWKQEEHRKEPPQD